MRLMASKANFGPKNNKQKPAISQTRPALRASLATQAQASGVVPNYLPYLPQPLDLPSAEASFRTSRFPFEYLLKKDVPFFSGDGSDEAKCTEHRCNPDQEFSCGDGYCISAR